MVTFYRSKQSSAAFMIYGVIIYLSIYLYVYVHIYIHTYMMCYHVSTFIPLLKYFHLIFKYPLCKERQACNVEVWRYFTIPSFSFSVAYFQSIIIVQDAFLLLFKCLGHSFYPKLINISQWELKKICVLYAKQQQYVLIFAIPEVLKQPCTWTSMIALKSSYLIGPFCVKV